jgi:hypothetical protein
MLALLNTGMLQFQTRSLLTIQYVQHENNPKKIITRVCELLETMADLHSFT